jgi:DNA-binding MarR family transcriptional regulator
MTATDDISALERALIRAARTVGRLDLPARLAEVPLGKESYWLLNRVEELGPMRASDLAAALNLDASTISRQTHKLVDAGLIERSIDPVDGRACLLAVSERGRDAQAEVVAFRRQQLAEMLREWSDADRRLVTNLLDRLADDLGGPEGVSTRSATRAPQRVPQPS